MLILSGCYSLSSSLLLKRNIIPTHLHHNFDLRPTRSHGGQHVSEHLHKRLHGMIEEVDRVTIDETIAFTKRLGAFFFTFPSLR